MAATWCTSKPKKICRKCQGTCPPCRPWRCKNGKGRSLEECANELEKTFVGGGYIQKRSLKKGSLKHISKGLSSLSLRNDFNDQNRITREDSSSCDKSSEGLPSSYNLSGIATLSTSNEDFSSNGVCTSNSSSGSPVTSLPWRQMPFPTHLKMQETSHIFLAIAADPVLVQYCKTVLKHVTAMPEIPEINSLNDSRCIWPHSVHLTIHSFGKVLNIDIPRIANYCRKNIELIEPFHLNVTGLFHHLKLHTIGFAVEKRTAEPLRPIKTNMSRWFNWDGYTPILSVVRTQGPRGAKFSCAPLSEQSIDIILQRFGGVRYVQKVVPRRDIQLCLARSSTETTFYKNLLV